MKISFDDIQVEYLNNVLTTIKQVGIESITLEQGRMRGMDDGKIIFLLQEDNVPEFPFDTMCLSRVGDLLTRLKLARTRSGTKVTAEQSDEGLVEIIKITSKGLRTSFRCSNPTLFPAPKAMNDKVAYQFNVPEDFGIIIQQGAVAMGISASRVSGTTDTQIMIKVVDGQGTLEFIDINNDILSINLDNPIVDVNNDAPPTFQFKYELKYILPIVKALSNDLIKITSKGILITNTNGLQLHTLAQL